MVNKTKTKVPDVNQRLPLEFITLSAITIFFLIGMLLANIHYGMDNYLDAWRTPHAVFLSWLSLSSLYIAVLYLLSPYGRLRGSLILFILLLYQALVSYHFTSGSPFDFSVVALNIDSAFNSESFGIISERLDAFPFIHLSCYLLVVLLWRPIRRSFFSPVPYSRKKFCIGFASLGLYTVMTTIGLAPHDELGLFLLSTATYYRNTGQYQFDEKYPKDSYPYVVTEQEPKPPTRTPHIFIVEIESFNSGFVRQKNPDGLDIMPVFSGLLSKGLSVEHFYGNTIQSSKGQFATLFSLLPDLRKKEFISYVDTNFYSLAALLHDNGYITWFVKAFKTINFDNTGEFVLKNGFMRAFSIHDVLKPAENTVTWGWGIEDQLFYRRFFEYLDTCSEVTSGKKPLFVLLHTVMNHMMFNKTPPDLRFMYHDPQNTAENYANTIHLTDKHLAIFFEELSKRNYLKDSMIIITGDHSVPTGEHGYDHNEVSYYEEFFRTPFLLIYPDIVPSKRIRAVAYSQIDIAPTILDAIGLVPPKHHFQGQSMLHPKNLKRPIFLIQPYNGTFLGIVDFPLKYVRHLSTGKEYVYNLRSDPKETTNIRQSIDNSILNRLRGFLQEVYLNQYLLENNQIWPETSK